MINVENARKAAERLGGFIEALILLAPLVDGARADTVFALGNAAGVLSKAKALIHREIDDAERTGSSA